MSILQRETQLVPLLAYCLADVDLSVGAAACQRLLRLRLLPLADGSLAEAVAYSAGQSQGQGRSRQQQQQQLVFVVTEELELLLLGSQSECAWQQQRGNFSRSSSTAALEHCLQANNVRFCEQLRVILPVECCCVCRAGVAADACHVTDPHQFSRVAGFCIECTSQRSCCAAVGVCAEHLLLDVELLGAALTAKLSLAASYNCTNLQLLSVQHLVASILPQLLPQHWQHAAAVSWDTAAAAAGDSTEAVVTEGGLRGTLVTW
jgi:hypothetical protein